MPRRTQARSKEGLALQRMIGLRLRQARDVAGISQQPVVDALGYSQSWLQAIESGTNGVLAADLIRLADYYGYPPAYFLDPAWAPAAPPKTRIEWEHAYPDQPDLARLHFLMDAVIRQNETVTARVLKAEAPE